MSAYDRGAQRLTVIEGLDDVPEIKITPDLHLVVDEAVKALAACPDIYQRGGRLVRVERDDSPLRGIVRSEPTPCIVDIPLASLLELLTRFANWSKVRDGELVACMPTKEIVGALAARGRWDGIRRLGAVVEAPVLRTDGTVLDRPGYDSTTGLLFLPVIDFGRIPERPTRQDARAALDALIEVVADFPFSKSEHRAACLAGILTPFARHAICGPSPLFLVDANVRGSGKSLLCDVVSEIATGRRMPRMAYPDNDTELEKRITALALAGDPLVLVDNIIASFGCASLDAALTADTWRGRKLGKSEMTPNIPLVATWYATANNVAIAADTARRVLHLRLSSDRERPEERDGFRHPQLLDWVRAERARLVRAVLTVLRGYVVAGRPARLKPWGSFEAWSDLVRGALVWLDEPDPVATREELTNTADTEFAALRGLLAAWPEVDPDGTGATVAQLLTAIATPGARYERMRAAVLELVPTPGDKLPSAVRVGKRLSHFRDRIVDRAALTRTVNRDGIAVWWVQRVEATS